MHNKKTTIILGVIVAFILVGCNRDNSTAKKKIEQVENLQQIDFSKDKEEIQNLIRQTLKWADSENSIDLLPVLTNKDGICIGIDLNKHKSNLDKLRATGYFANEFIENYNQIILELDKKLRNNEFEQWSVNELPPFRFANDVDPWTLCQDVPYDNPSPWDYVEIEVIELDNSNAQLVWKWGNLSLNTDSGWKKFSYKFRTVKENGKWKIAYLQGFDFKESTQNDGL